MKKNNIVKIIFLIVSIMLLLVGCDTGEKTLTKKDDWVYKKPAREYDGFLGGFKGVTFNAATSMMAMDSASLSAPTLGFSVGGAKDINNFRENIENGYFPLFSDITYNGLSYDYMFDTGRQDEVSEDLFSPSYSTAISKDPISGEKEYYMTVGLNSNIKESDFARKKLNLTVVLDISGSMDSYLDSYYYDFDKKLDGDDGKTKMQLANESLNILIDKLNDDDRLGIVLFDDTAYLAKPLNLIGETDVKELKKHVSKIEAMGGTNFDAGYTEATKLYQDLKDTDKDEYENRIIVITDAMPNRGVTSRGGLLSYVEENAKEGIYTTFIGVGVDFNTGLIEDISKVKGANYYSVHSAKEFKERMGEQFEYMVTPLVFDLNLKLESEDYKIVKVYGSDAANEKSGEIMKVNTLFPSKTSETGEVKGGVVLLKIEPLRDSEEATLTLKVTYKDRNGVSHNSEKTISFESSEDEKYDNTGIRKAIALTRYANVLKNWIISERTERKYTTISLETGIFDCDFNETEIVYWLGENERASTKLSVSKEGKEIFEMLKAYMQGEMQAVEDDTMKQEIEILDKLLKVKN